MPSLLNHRTSLLIGSLAGILGLSGPSYVDLVIRYRVSATGLRSLPSPLPSQNRVVADLLQPGPIDITYSIGGAGVRMDIRADSRKTDVSCFTPSASDTTCFDHGARTHWIMPPASAPVNFNELLPPATLTRTGEQSVIAGHAAERFKLRQYLVEIPDELLEYDFGTLMAGELWLAPGIPWDQRQLPGILPIRFPDDFRPGMPLRYIVGSGDSKFEMEALQVKQEALPSNVFQRPEGYRLVSVSR